jgi:transcriptional regulator GlxA family with amidase domain
VEVLDFAGPFEVFGVAGAPGTERPFNVFTVAEFSAPVLARNGLSINPAYSIANSPPADLLVVPGGRGTRTAMYNAGLLAFISTHAAKHDQGALTLSVCTGSLMLGRAGLLDGLGATTHHSAFDELREAAPGAVVQEGARMVDNGSIVTSAGISAGIDMALHVVARLCGEEMAVQTARYMEYDWMPGAGVRA